jgi:hypothetical protein
MLRSNAVENAAVKSPERCQGYIAMMKSVGKEMMIDDVVDARKWPCKDMRVW